MARKKVPGGPQQPVPESGERIIGLPPAGSKFNKAPKPLTRAQQRENKAATEKRQRWEASEVGQKRTTNPYADSKMPIGQRYFIDNYDKEEHVGPRVYDRQLPGMADPNAAPRPPLWEELSEEARQHAINGLKKAGTSVEQITKDIGTQLDQAKFRADSLGHDNPYGSKFYAPGSEQRQRLEQSAAAVGIPKPIHAQLNAFTSPQTMFSRTKSTGEVSYPNDEAAVHSARLAQQGFDYTRPDVNEASHTIPGATHRVSGYKNNIRKAASAVSQHIKGVAPADWRTDKGQDMFSQSPKTGPYANSWDDTHPQFTVGDVHTAGGGAFPHLSTQKGTHPSGDPQKSEREWAIDSVPFSHSIVDYAHRQAMAERNLSHVRESQGTQWGEEQLQRGEAGLRSAPTQQQAYRSKPTSPSISLKNDELFHSFNGKETVNERVIGTDNRSRAAKRFDLDF